MFTILCYSAFTFLGCIATNIWELAAFRFLAGAGIGREWTLGGILVAEEWPESRRLKGGAYMHTGYYVGLFLAAILNYFIGARYGWRAMFIVGGTPGIFASGMAGRSVSAPPHAGHQSALVPSPRTAWQWVQTRSIDTVYPTGPGPSCRRLDSARDP